MINVIWITVNIVLSGFQIREIRIIWSDNKKGEVRKHFSFSM